MHARSRIGWLMLVTLSATCPALALDEKPATAPAATKPAASKPAPITYVPAASAPVFLSDRIRYDGQCFTIDGKDMFLFSGAFHYFRCPQPLWRDRLAKIKAAGFVAVETYVPWNWHERQRPASIDDYSKLDMRELEDFLKLAIDEFGLHVLIRPGPYICAEWDGGGYPQWLAAERPASFVGQWTRSDEPSYLAWCKHWYAAVAKVVAPYQLTRRPVGKTGVILWQIENEYHFRGPLPEYKHNQLQFLAKASREYGIDVPLFTCLTRGDALRSDPYLSANVLETLNSYPKLNDAAFAENLTEHQRYQPERMRMMTEMQGGWFTRVGGVPPDPAVFTGEQITHVTLQAWAAGFTANNYYMLFGGTNFGDWNGAMMASSYDYAAPIRECGGVGERYAAVAALGHMLREHGERLTRTVEEPARVLKAPADDVIITLRRSQRDGSRYLFVRTSQSKEPRQGELAVEIPGRPTLTVALDLPPFGMRVLYLPPGATDAAAGQWLPKPFALPARPTNLPKAQPVLSVRRQVDPGPDAASWRPMTVGQSVEDLGVYDRRYVFYRAKLTPGPTTAPATGGGTLAYKAIGWDESNLAIDGKPSQRLQGPPVLPPLKPGQYVSPAGRPRPFDPNYRWTIPADARQLQMVWEQFGRPNGGPGMEHRHGLFEGVTLSGFAAQWEFADQSVGTKGQWWSPNLDDSQWPIVEPAAPTPTAASDVPPAGLVWYRVAFTLPKVPADVWLPWAMHVEATGNGMLYLNGHPLGRWWQVGPQTEFYLPECWLNTGDGQSNVLTLCLRPNEFGAALNSVELRPYADLAEFRPATAR